MRQIIATDIRTIFLGRAGEDNAVQIMWPNLLMEWYRMYGLGGTVSLLVRHPGEYIAHREAVEIQGDTVSWTVSLRDVETSGFGACELKYEIGGTIVKSPIWVTVIGRSLSVSEDN